MCWRGCVTYGEMVYIGSGDIFRGARCPCHHLWLNHDVDEYRGDGSEMCCVEGCDQNGCPGRTEQPYICSEEFSA